MVKSFNFLAPSLHPNTLLDIAFPLAGPSAPDPLVKSLAVKYASDGHDDFQPLGLAKVMSDRGDGTVLIGDDAFRLSTVAFGKDQEGNDTPPQIVAQHQTAGKAGNMWAGAVQVNGGNIAGLTNGTLSFIPGPSSSSTQTVRETLVLNPIKCLAAPSTDATTFAMAGREVDVCIYDVERTFAEGRTQPDMVKETKTPKRGIGKVPEKLQDGEVWRAKNVSHDNLGLRVPIHHLCLTYNSHTPTSLYSGMMTGSVRHYDTRQRKPLSDWKLAREGGIGSLAFSSIRPNELFFADRSDFFGCVDLRTGRLLYSMNQPVSIHAMLPFAPCDAQDGQRQIGLAALGSDAALRLVATTPSPEWVDGKPPRGNWGPGQKGVLAGMAGGVGHGSVLWRGYGEMEDRKEDKVGKAGGEGEGDEDEEDEEAGEEVWDGLDEVEDVGSEEEEEDSWDEDSDDEEEEKAGKKRKVGNEKVKGNVKGSAKAGRNQSGGSKKAKTRR